MSAIISLFRRIKKSATFSGKVERRTSLTPINQTDPQDIFVVGYPKSGNTWMQNLLAGIVFGTNVRLTPDSLINELVPDVHGRMFYHRFGTPTFFKSHHLPRPEYRRVIYLVRDGRDAMVSYFHYLSALDGSEPDFLKMVTTGEGLFPCRWHEHVEAWRKNPYHSEVISVSYESLKRDTVEQLRRVCQFAGFERSDQFLKSLADSCSFEAMREKEKVAGWNSPVWPRDQQFIRRGETGSFRDEMPTAVLAEFMRQASRTLIRAGYPAG